MISRKSFVELRGKLQPQFSEAAGGKDVMTFSDFLTVTGCRSPLFAQRLFDCIDADHSGGISYDEFLDAMYTLRSKNAEARIQFIFHLFDLNNDGVISSSELTLVLCASVEEGNINIPDVDKEMLVAMLLELFDANNNGSISFEEFEQVMKSYPDILSGLSLEGISMCRAKDNQRTRWLNVYKGVLKAVYWVSNNPQKTITYSVLMILLMGSFFWDFQKYLHNCDEVVARASGVKITAGHSRVRDCHLIMKRVLMGWSLPVSKGCGRALKTILTIILLPVSRSLMTSLRPTFLKKLFYFDGVVGFHQTLGTLGFAFGWIHALCHWIGMARWADTSRVDSWRRAFPDERHQPELMDLLTTSSSLSGTALLSIYTVAAFFALDYPKKFKFLTSHVREDSGRGRLQSTLRRLGQILNDFNYFWYSHHLFALFYFFLLIHPLPHVPSTDKGWGSGDTWVWVCVPVVLYSAEKLVRFLRSDARSSTVLLAETLVGNVVRIHFQKPRGMVYVAGQYVFIKCPEVSRFEWHPFTLTSSPGDPFLEVCVRAEGDWTRALYDLVDTRSGQTESIVDSTPEEKPLELSQIQVAEKDCLVVPSNHHNQLVCSDVPTTPKFAFKVLVDGPFGAPCQNYKDYSVVLLVGAGIGVTPFASVLNELFHTMNLYKCKRCGLTNLPHTFRAKKVYFCWTVRSRHEASWFKYLLEALSAQDDSDLVDISIHITSIRRANDVRVMLLKMAHSKHQAQAGIDAVSGISTKIVTYFGRPSWPEVFGKVRAANPEERFCGVFFCGPAGLGRVLRKESSKQSSQAMKFEYHEEIFN